jgi:lysophospholipase L1-like esterase
MVALAVSKNTMRFRKSAVWAGALILPSVLLACVVELALRVFDPIGFSYFAEAGKYFASMQPNDKYAYIHTPGFRAKFQGVNVVINSAGFRGPEVEAGNLQRRIRVLVLGDSVVFGWGAPQNEIFPIRLQSMLERVIPEAQVIPAGVGSWNTRTEYEYLRSTGVHVGPKMIILLITANDLEPKRSGWTDIRKSLLFPSDTPEVAAHKMWKAAVAKSYLMGYVQYLLKRHRLARQESEASMNLVHWEDARQALDGMVQLSRDIGASLIIFLYGSTDTIENNSVLRLYRDHLKAKGLDYLALPAELFTDRRLRNSVVDGHPNSDGHAIIAERMYEHLLPIIQKLNTARPARTVNESAPERDVRVPKGR